MMPDDSGRAAHSEHAPEATDTTERLGAVEDQALADVARNGLSVASRWTLGRVLNRLVGFALACVFIYGFHLLGTELLRQARVGFTEGRVNHIAVETHWSIRVYIYATALVLIGLALHLAILATFSAVIFQSSNRYPAQLFAVLTVVLLLAAVPPALITALGFLIDWLLT